MTESPPSEFVAAHELSRYPAAAVMRLIEATKQWLLTRNLVEVFDFDGEEIELSEAVKALEEEVRSG